MLLSFELSMPTVKSWNGKWSGERERYVIVKSFSKKLADKILIKDYYTYNFSDGWTASISVVEVTKSEAAKLKKVSKGFCGYDWMVDSIIGKQEIKPIR